MINEYFGDYFGDYSGDATGAEIIIPDTGSFNQADETREIARTKAKILDIPLLNSNDALTCESGAYLVVTPEGLDSLKKWFGGTLYKSEDGINFNIFKAFSKKSLFGIIKSFIPEADEYDEDNVITVEITDGWITLESISDEDLAVGKNLCLCGNELIQFKNAELVGENIYELSTLLRGRYGTEWAMYKHRIDEDFILLNPGMAHRFPIEPYEIGSSKSYATVTDGLILDDNSEVLVFTYTGQCLIPYSPCHGQIVKEENGDWTISWIGRPRYPTEFDNHNRCYQMDMARIVKLHINQTPGYVYKLEDQVKDFGEEQIILVVRVCQVSPTVGSGKSLTITNLDNIESVDHIKSYGTLLQLEYKPVRELDVYQSIVQVEYAVDTSQVKIYQSIAQVEYKPETSKIKCSQSLAQVEYYITPSHVRGYQSIVQVEHRIEDAVFSTQLVLQIEYS